MCMYGFPVPHIRTFLVSGAVFWSLVGGVVLRGSVGLLRVTLPKLSERYWLGKASHWLYPYTWARVYRGTSPLWLGLQKRQKDLWESRNTVPSNLLLCLTS